VNTDDIKERKKRWKRQMKHVESTLRDIQTTVSVVEKNREQFMHSISHDELQSRKLFLNDMQQRVRKMKQESNSSSIKEKLLNDEKACAARRSAGPNKQKDPGILSSLKNQMSSANEEDATILDKRAQTQVLLEQQDQTLDQLDVAVERVGVIAGAIHEEISSQNKMLTDLEEDLTDVEEKLGVVMGKLAKLLQTKSKCQLGLILALSLTVVVLFFLVLYT
jgi:syntaxin 6